MVLYTCKNCGYETKLKGDYKKHLNRKKPCKNINFEHESMVLSENAGENCSQMLTNCSQIAHKLLTNSLVSNLDKVTTKDLSNNKDIYRHIEDQNKNKKNHDFFENEQFVSNCEQFVSNSEQNEQKFNEIIFNSENLKKKPGGSDEQNFSCSFCKKKFTRNSNLRRHMNHYCKKKPQENIGEDIYYNIIDTLDELKKDKNDYRKREEEWNRERSELYNKLEKANKNVYNNNYFNQNNIIIHNHGEEDIKYITADYLTELIKLPYQAIPKLIKHIHFHPEHPENHNIRITNRKEPYIRVFKNQKWNLADKKKVLEGILDKSVSLLDNHFTEKVDQLSDKQKERYSDFTLNFTDDYNEQDIKKKCEKDIELIVINESIENGEKNI